MTPSSKKEVTSKYFPDPRVELRVGDDILGESTWLVITPNGIIVKVEIEGIESEEQFFDWDFIDEARNTIIDNIHGHTLRDKS